MSEQVQTLFGSDEWEVMAAEEEISISAVDGKRLIYGIGEMVRQLRRAKVKKKDILILMPKRALACIKLAAPVELVQGKSHMTLFGCHLDINKQSDRIFVGQEVKV